jgi:MFS family permease
MSIYAGSLQVGIASGFIFGEVTSAALGSWRWPYILEAIFTAILATLPLFAEKDPRFLQKSQEKVNSWGEQLSQLLSNATYVCCV